VVVDTSIVLAIVDSTMAITLATTLAADSTVAILHRLMAVHTVLAEASKPMAVHKSLVVATGDFAREDVDSHWTEEAIAAKRSCPSSESTRSSPSHDSCGNPLCYK